MNGGSIRIDTPPWYFSDRNDLYPYDNAECFSDNLDEIELTIDGNLEIKYTKLIGAITDTITLNCKGWRNPIVPDVSAQSYIITSLDPAGEVIDISPSFIFDASAFTAYQIVDSAIEYTLGTSYV